MARERREARLCRSTRTFGYTAAPRRAPTARRDAPRYPADAIGLARNRCPATRRLETTPSLPTCVPSSAAILALFLSLVLSLYVSSLHYTYLYEPLAFVLSFVFLLSLYVVLYFFFLSLFCLRCSSLQWYVALSSSATFFHHTSIRFIL